MGTKQQPGMYDCYDKAEDDEPMFTLLARDPHAPILVRLWADIRESLELEDSQKVNEARTVARAMENWKLNHPGHGD